MRRKQLTVLPLAGALAALGGSGTGAAEAKPAVEAAQPAVSTSAQAPNTIVSTGETLLGFTVIEQADGTVVAQHASHASHASHVSHSSHVSSR